MRQQDRSSAPAKPNAAPFNSAESGSVREITIPESIAETAKQHQVPVSEKADLISELDNSTNHTETSKIHHVASNTTEDRQQQASVTERTGFATWILSTPENKRLEFAIELLINWLAYADNRFNAETKSRVFRMENPDNRNFVRRLAFEQDTLALSDAINYLQKNALSIQREQIINLLLVLLVHEKAVSPIINNLVRFLADAFGIGQARLHTIFEKAFDHEMPQIPRLDKSLWWQLIDEEQLLRWDIRALASQPEDIRYRWLLGLPLSGALQQHALMSNYRRALDRCLPEHVDQLGRRATALVNSESDKYGLAFDSLWELME